MTPEMIAQRLEEQAKADARAKGIVKKSLKETWKAVGLTVARNDAYRVHTDPVRLPHWPNRHPVKVIQARGSKKLWAETGGKCVYCDRETPDASKSKEHIWPASMRGSNKNWNFLPACKKCNSNRALRLPLWPLVLEKYLPYVRSKEILASVMAENSKIAAVVQWRETFTNQTPE